MGSKGHTLCRVMVGLWIVTLAVAGWMFVAGWTKPCTDGRQEIGLAPAERDHVLAEMRQLFKAVDGVVRGLSEPFI